MFRSIFFFALCLINIAETTSDEWFARNYHAQDIYIEPVSRSKNPINKNLDVITIWDYNLNELRDSSLRQILLPKSDIAYQWYYEPVALVDSVRSYFILAKSEANDESYLFIINMKNSQLKSSLLVSNFLFVSNDYNEHSYSIVDGNIISVYNHRIHIIDDYVIDNAIKTPLLQRLRYYLHRLFSKKEKQYRLIAKFQIDSSGYINSLL